MKKVIEKKLCTGCTACLNICPKKAITLEKNEKGFKYPMIDKTKCINCGLCQKKCPVLSTNKNDSINKCYIGFNRSDKERESSSSGGIFSLIASEILNDNGIVIGAAFINNKLKHISIEEKSDLDKLKGSKYLQSDIGNIFEYIKKNIIKRKILFVGTPCQVAGLKQIVKSNNLLCIDFICHGVPSPKLFERYIKYLEEKYNDKVLNYNFRDKKTGWSTYSNTIIFKNKQKSQSAYENSYMKIFLSDIALRESCYNCNFKLGNKYSDITLGDFWGGQKFYPDMYDEKGVSAIIINTEKGDNIFEIIKKKLVYKDCALDEILSGNSSLKQSSKFNDFNKRNLFFEDLNKINFDKLTRKYIKNNYLLKIKKIIKKFMCK